MTKEKFGRKGDALWFWLGVIIIAFTIIPNLILGENSIFTYHDQLDGELIAYILQARHLFSGDVLPEFMGGISKTALTMPAPVCVLLFLGGNGLTALIVMQIGGRLTGFVGMYLLSREVECRAWIGAAVGLLYGLLPFLPVYGLSQFGIPLLFWCGLQLRKRKCLVFSYCYTALFGLASSLVLVGFGLLGMGLLLFVWDFVRKKQPWHFLAAWQLLLCIYVAENFRLLFQLLGFGEEGVSHKAEYVLNGQLFWPIFLQSLLSGGQHSNGYQMLVVPILLIAVAVAIVVSRRPGLVNSRLYLYMGVCLGWNCLFALIAALWGSSFGIWLRGALGALRAFQMDRLLWIAPCFWYLMVACGLTVLWEMWKQYKGITRLLAGGCLAVSVVAAGATGIWILYSGDIKSNIQKIRNPKYGLLSYRDYYAVGVMEQVRDFLKEQTKKGQEEYQVVSLGIDPAAALYHGFYCLDGYSNNYPLTYKHQFRQIIYPELEKSEYLREYFDNWGNRCYLFSAECPGYYTIEKNGFIFQDYSLNVEALRQMGGSYLLSAAYIQNADAQGLRLMNDVPFETEDSYYCIFIYEIGSR